MRVLFIARSEPEASPLADALRRRGHEVDARWADTQARCEEALASGLFDLAVCDLRAPLPPAIRTLRESADRPPVLAYADAPDGPALAEALRIGAALWLPTSEEALDGALAAALRDGDRRRRQRAREAFDEGQRGALEGIARGAPLPEILLLIVRLIEGQEQGLMCSILLVDATGHVRHGAAPSLPQAYIDAIDGSEIGPEAGSCGAAAYLGAPVLIEDIAVHPNWAEYRHLALPYGLRASWSTPIFSPDGAVLGTFAMYYGEPRLPNDDERALIAAATHLAAIAILRDRDAQAIAQSERRFRQILATTHEGVWVGDTEGVTTYANARLAQMVGIPADEIVGQPASRFVHDDDRPALERGFANALRGVSASIELRLKRAGGELAWALVAGSPLLADDGSAIGLVGLIADLTEQRRAVQARLESEAELRATFDHAALAIALVSPEGVVAKCNPACERLFGYPEAELLGMRLEDLTEADDRERYGPRYERLLASQEGSFQLEERFVQKGGRVVVGRLTVSLARDPRGGVRHAVAMIEDVTEARRLEEEVRGAERLRALLFEHVSDVVFHLGLRDEGEYRLLAANPAFFRATGLRSDVVGRRVEDIIPPEALPRALERYRQAIDARRTITWEEASPYPAAPQIGEITLTPVFDAGGRCTDLVGTVHDITERKQAEERIAAQAALLDRARDAILVYDLDGVIRYWNAGAARLYGWPREEVVGTRIADVIYPEPEAFDTIMRSVLAEGGWAGRSVRVTRAGQPRDVDIRLTLVRDAAGVPTEVLALHSDVTARTQLEAQVVAAQRMESLGTLAGGIAHDFNNILSAITGSVLLARRELPEEHPAQARLVTVERAARRAADLVKQILAFSREREPHRAAIQLQPVVEEALELLWPTLLARLQVVVDFAPGAFEVVADASQIHQVLVNLATNAAHAMGERGGRLRIALAPVLLDAPLTGAGATAAPGRYMRLTVADDGPGMDAATLERIFDPFFTTKPVGKGTGLGLSVALRIVRSHGGAVVVASEPGVGTTFDVYIPAAPGAEDVRGPEAPPQGRQQRVMYVDDDASLVTLATHQLETLGYRAHGYTDPGQALRELLAAPDAVDAIVADYAMAGMSGLELAREARRVRPGLPIVLVADPLTDEAREQAHRLGVRAVIAHADFIGDLASALEALFGGVRGPARSGRSS